MSEQRERFGLGRRSRLAKIAVAVEAPVTAAIMIAACLAAAGCSVGLPGADQTPQQAATAASTETSSGVPLPHNPDTGPPADPFAGTPADDWADGAAGIVLPAATAVGGYTAAQVDLAYETTRKLLLAGYLDKRTLLGGAPTAFADLLTNLQRTEFLQGLNKTGVDKHGYLLSTRGYVMSFWPGSAQLIGSVIKVQGTMRAQAAIVGGHPELAIHVDYIFVYPVEPLHQPDDWMRIVTHVSWMVEFGNWEDAATTFEPWVDPTGNSSVSGGLCTPLDGYVHPDYPAPASGVDPSASPSGTPLNPYELGQTRTEGCQATTGT